MVKTIIDILAGKNLITLEEGFAARKAAKEGGVPLDDELYKRGITEEDLAEAKSALTGYPVKYLKGIAVPYEVLRDIPEESARHYAVIPLGRHEGYLDIGMLHPDDVLSAEVLRFVAARVNMPVRIFIITPSDFANILEEYRSLSGEVTKALGEFEKEYESLGEDVKIRRPETAHIVEEAPITKMMAVILRHAVEGMASDIHIEPTRTNLRVRFRVDGILYTSLVLPLDVHPAVISRLKIMTNLKIDETRVPQDGRFHAEISNRSIDFRISTLPTAFGEKVAIRILDPQAGIAGLKDLGLGGVNLVKLEEAMRRPFGLILITGPTGSGKSTTLYAMLQKLNEERYNIVSLEDPVEYYIEGVNQSQIRPEVGYDFSTGLRHIMRQDPDIIMVGEIRDKETAALAIHAALTGHLVLSTLHTNNSIGVIPRLIDMGVDPFLIAPTLIMTIGQRLARKLCLDSRRTIPIEGEAKTLIEAEIAAMPEEQRKRAEIMMKNEIYQPQASPTCPKGTRGRIGIFEALIMTPELERIILEGSSETKIRIEAQRQGMITMKQDGVLKVLEGTIGFEELLEVV